MSAKDKDRVGLPGSRRAVHDDSAGDALDGHRRKLGELEELEGAELGRAELAGETDGVDLDRDADQDVDRALDRDVDQDIDRDVDHDVDHDIGQDQDLDHALALDLGPAKLDALLRRSMRALEDQVPTGYFEALPAQIAVRLDDKLIGQSGAEIAIAKASRLLDASSLGGALDARPSARASKPAASRAQRRSLVTTEVVGPVAWWQSRMMAVGLGAASLVAALVLIVVVVRGGGAEQQPSLGAASMREPGVGRLPGRRSDEGREEPDPQTAAREAVLLELSSVLPQARACLGARPAGAPIVLELTVDPDGDIRDVLVRGPLPNTSAARCISDAVHRAGQGGKLSPRPQPQTVRVPLFD